jgi:hypothetical protein
MAFLHRGQYDFVRPHNYGSRVVGCRLLRKGQGYEQGKWHFARAAFYEI